MPTVIEQPTRIRAAGSQAKTILEYTALTIGLFLGAVRDRIHRCVVVKDHRGTWL